MRIALNRLHAQTPANPVNPVPAQPALFTEDKMSIQTSPLPLTFRGRARAARRGPAVPQLYIAVGLFLAVLIAEAFVIATAPPSLTDIGSLYITTT
jgi:hypothetical protein